MPGMKHHADGMSRLVERRLHLWGEKDIQARPFAHLAEGQAEIDYITVSRQFESGGEEIAKNLSELLGWEIYDKAILDYMAENMKVHKSVLESVDEGTSSWIRDWLTSLFVDPPLSHTTYCRHLVKVLLIISRHKNAIIIGRAAGLVLPRDRGLSVRITAPLELRTKRYADQEGIDIEQARSYVNKQDLAQRSFVKGFLHEDVDDPKHYDIVCNTDKLTAPSVAKLIWRCLDQRKAGQEG